MSNFGEQVKSVRTLVVGDVMLDRFIRGRVSRISPEAPVPVVEVESSSDHPGGAANVAKNAVAYTGQVGILGKISADTNGDSLEALLSREKIDTSYLVRVTDGETTTKTRVVAGHQQVVRFDRELARALTTEEEKLVLAALDRAEGNFDCVIVQDYAKGLLTPPVVERLRHFSAAGAVVTVDPNPRHSCDWSGFTAVKPNLLEACAATGVSIQTADIVEPATDPKLRDLADCLMEKWNPQHLLLTIGEHGMIYLDANGGLEHLPARAREVFDVSGAGDTAIAVFSLALGAGIEGKEAALWANEAASVVVGKLGTATASLSELAQAVALHR